MTQLSIRPLAAEDAPALTRCFERCYGDSYVTASFYDPAEIRARVDDGRLRSVVAVDPSNEVVGHMGLTRRDPTAITADAGNTVVDPRYRNQKLAARLGGALVHLSREVGLVGFHHYPTTMHPALQKLAVAGGGTETGIMLDYIPAGTEYLGIGSGANEARLAVVVVYQPLAEAPERQVFTPERYAQRLSSLYASIGLARRAGPVDASAATATRLDAHFDARRGLLRARVTEVGDDLGACVDRALEGAEADVTQVDLPLADPGTPDAVDALRERGLHFAALLPEYLDGDVLRLQRTREGGGALAHADLASDEARALLDFARSDRVAR